MRTARRSMTAQHMAQVGGVSHMLAVVVFCMDSGTTGVMHAMLISPVDLSRACRMQSHCQELTLRMLGSLSKRLKEARRARQPLRPRHPRSGVRPPVATRRRVLISDKAAADSARPVAMRSGSIAADGAAAAVCTGNQSVQCGRASGGSGIPPLKPDSSSFQEWHGALDSAYAVMKGMLGGLSMDAVHAAHAPILLLSFDASKMATQLQRATSDLCRLQVLCCVLRFAWRTHHRRRALPADHLECILHW